MELSSYYNENNGTLENTSPRKPYLNVISSSSQASAEQHKKILRYIIYFLILK